MSNLPEPPVESIEAPPTEEVRTKLQRRKLVVPKLEPGVSVEQPASLFAPLQPIAGAAMTPTDPSLRFQLNITTTLADRQRLVAIARETEEKLPEVAIQSILFTIASEQEIREISVIGKGGITSAAENGPGTINDPRMGSIEEKVLCHYCHRDNISCTGHFGHIELARPILHPLYRRYTIEVLRCVCNSCGGLLLPPKDIENLRLGNLSGQSRLLKLAKASEGKPCRHTHVGNKQCYANPTFQTTLLKDHGKITYKIGGTKKNPGKESEMTVEQIDNIFATITTQDAMVMGFENGTHPSRFIMKLLPVIPPCDRTPVFRDGVKSLDQLTIMYMNIVNINNQLRAATDDHLRKTKYEELIHAISHLIDNGDGAWHQGQRREFQSFKQRLTGKEGQIRGQSMGKRVNFTARTVIGPDPSLKFGQISLPEVFAPLLTRPVRIAAFNREKMTELLRRGQVETLIQASGPRAGQLQRVSDKLRREFVPKIGDVLERWLQNGDYVIANRQPTLHKQSMMGYEVILRPQSTIGLHLSVTTAHNADFFASRLLLF